MLFRQKLNAKFQSNIINLIDEQVPPFYLKCKKKMNFRSFFMKIRDVDLLDC